MKLWNTASPTPHKPTAPAFPAPAQPTSTRTCCGNALQPRMAEVRDAFGDTFYAFVWVCPSCRRVFKVPE